MSEAPDGAAPAASEDTSAADQVTDTTQVQGDEPSGDDAAAATDDEGQADQPKPKKSPQERINEVTAQKHEALREAEYWKAKALQAPQPQPAPEAQQQPQGDGRPARDDYEDDFEYIEALTDWKAEQAAERLAQRNRQQDQARTARENFHTRKTQLFPGGEPDGLKSFLALKELPVAVIEIVGESEIGPKIADHLGANPAELRRLEGLSPIQQARELTRLEHRLSEPAKPTPKTATDAPEPPPQARGAGGRFTVAADTDDFAAFEKQFGS